MKTEHLSFNLLSDYLDGELDQQTLSVVTKHLNECPKCQADYLNLKKMNQLTLALRSEKIAVSEKFIDKTFEKYHKKRSRKNIHKIFWPVSAAAVFAFVLFSGFLELPGFKHVQQNSVALNETEASRIEDVFREYTLEETDMNEALQILRSNRAKILEVKKGSIVAEAPVSTYQRIRYGVALSPDDSFFSKSGSGLLTVGTSLHDKPVQKSSKKSKERVVKFRIKLR